MKDLLIKQITEEIEKGNTSTLDKLLGDEKQILSLLNKDNLNIIEDKKPDFVLEGGMLIRAKKDLTGTSNCYNTPERIDIPKGTILQIPSEGTNRGDVFCRLIEGECIKILRGGSHDGEIRIMKPEDNRFDVVGLREGVNTRYPYDLGVAQKEFWELV